MHVYVFMSSYHGMTLNCGIYIFSKFLAQDNDFPAF